MKLYAPLALALLAAPLYAQTATDGTTLSSRIGPAFFSDEGMTMMRSPEEIQAGWDNLSPEDQGALRTRCEAVGINFQADMTESSGSAGSGVEPSDSGISGTMSAGTPQEPLVESGGDSGGGVRPTPGPDTAAISAGTPQEPLTESSGSSGPGVEPTNADENEGFMANREQLSAVCGAAANL